ncbi:hypothetical protein BDP27DRAFT_1364161 [Rhodocollybia butyracea]|uniref:Uncharacterized protein n=1 Tax=Rhodocollybia butyracea TaxID=206335 RepID=A0A9P5U633_9AGAR|nr:hypothetical protein BDP27DRAFT_1364161 [Rhodocollybia butyracea]
MTLFTKFCFTRRFSDLTAIKYSASQSQNFLQIPNYARKQLYHSRSRYLSLGRKFHKLTRQVTTYSVHPEKIWFKPDLPPNSKNAQELVDGNDLVPSLENEMCWVIPKKLDPQRFQTALQKTLVLFPTFAGRLRKSDNGYQISYNSQGLPVQFAQVDVVGHPAAKGTEAITSQDICTMAQFMDINPFTSLALEDDTPLVTMRLTYLTKTDQTVIGLSFSQIAADGPTVKLFIHTLSQFYQGLELSNQPKYFMRKWAAEGSKNTNTSINRPVTSSVTHKELVQQLWGNDTEGCSLLQIIFTPEEVRGLMKRIHQEINNPRVSVQHATVAYVVNLYNSFVNDPITIVRFILTYRSRETDDSSRYRDMDNVGNGIYLLDVPVANLPGLGDKAGAFRKAIINSREPHNLEALISARSSLGFEMMQNGQIMPWSAPGTTLVNGLHHLDFAEAGSFGCPGRAQIYYSTCYSRYLTLTKANPILLADGTWKRNESDVGVAIPVPRDVKEKMLEQKARDMQGLL